jgi:hypothetical protein
VDVLIWDPKERQAMKPPFSPLGLLGGLLTLGLYVRTLFP